MRLSSRWLVSLGVVTALGCTHATRPDAPATTDAKAKVALPPALVAVYARVVGLPTINDASTATDEQVREARALAADCAHQFAEWLRGRETQAGRVVELAGMPWPYEFVWTPGTAQHGCEDSERAFDATLTYRAHRAERVATLSRWTTLAKGDRADLVRRYGLPNNVETDARLQDRFWVYTRSVNRTGCTITYYFKQDAIERVDAEPATCFATQPPR